MRNEATQQCRGYEKRHIAVVVDQISEFVLIKAAARRHNLMRALGDMRERKQTRRVGLCGNVDETVVGPKKIDIGEIAHCHHRQIAVTEHSALGPARGAAGIEYPGRRVAVGLSQGRNIAAVERLAIGLADYIKPGTQIAHMRGEFRRHVRRRETQARLRVFHHVGNFPPMQPRIHGNGAKPRMPNGKQYFEVFGAICHGQRHAGAGRNAGQGAQIARDSRHAPRHLAVGAIWRGADGNRRTIGELPPGIGKV